MFTATCTTCRESESFDDYDDANDWWLEHAEDGHLAELVAETERLAAPN